MNKCNAVVQIYSILVVHPYEKQYCVHSSLVDYLAQVTYAKNCPTTFHCIFQLVWVSMTSTQNIRV